MWVCGSTALNYKCGLLIFVGREREERIIGQDEWDLYKLSSKFVCLVRNEPNLTTIVERVAEPESPVRENVRATQENPLRNRNGRFKPPPSVQRRVSDEQKRNERRRRAHFPPELDDFDFSSSDEEEEDDEADEDEVMNMGDDDTPPAPKRYTKSETVKMARAKIEEDRKRRRELNRQRRKMQEEGETPCGFRTTGPSTSNDTSPQFHFDFSETPRAKSMGPSASYDEGPPAKMKRKGLYTMPKPHASRAKHTAEPESGSGSEGESPRASKFYDKIDNARRHRTMSPKSAKKAAQGIHNDHRRKRRDEVNNRYKYRAEAKEKNFMRTLYEEARAKFFTDNHETHGKHAFGGMSSNSNQFSSSSIRRH